MNAGRFQRVTSSAWLAACLLLVACGQPSDVPIFLWHSVGEGGWKDFRDVPGREFDTALTLIEEWGATPITLDQLMDAQQGKGTLPPKPVVLTFDDGRACQYSVALPILEMHGMVAETFVVNDRLTDDEAHRFVEHDPQGDHPYLSWAELQVMANSGLFVVESHSLTHRRLPNLSRDEQRTEIAGSREKIAARTGQPVNFFAYPFGSFNSDSRDLAEAAGYRAALAVDKGLGTRYGLLRVSVHRGRLDSVIHALQKAFGDRPMLSARR